MANLKDYINNLKSDKSKMIETLRSRGEEVDDNATFTDLVPTIDNLGKFEITDASRLFYGGVRLEAINTLISAISPSCEKFNHMFYGYKGTEIPMFNCQNGKDFTQIFYGCSNITTIPQLDLSNCETLSGAFQSCSSLKTLPPLSLDKCLNLYYAFWNCSNLTTFSQDVSKVTNFEQAFYSCGLSNVDLDFSSAINCRNTFYQNRPLKSVVLRNSINVTDFFSAFGNCNALVSADLKTDSATNLSQIFYLGYALTDVILSNCGNVTSISGAFGSCSKLTNLSGLIDLGKSYGTTQASNYSSYTLDLYSAQRLTHESALNVLNGLYDIASKGCNPQKVRFHANVMALLSEDEIAIGTNKGWNVTT